MLAVGESLIPADEQALIGKETLVAVDKVYAAKATEIHSPPAAWDFQVGVVSAQKRTVALQMKLPTELPQQTIDNIIDLIRPFLGAYGARVVHLLYEIANDPPYWRNPLITVETNDLLDRLGLTRDRRGVHYSRNRETLRNVLNAAHGLEIVGEYTTWEGGVKVRKAMRKTVLSLIGATFDDGESSGLSTEELFQRGLPKDDADPPQLLRGGAPPGRSPRQPVRADAAPGRAEEAAEGEPRRDARTAARLPPLPLPPDADEAATR